ncbi:hypothetical protein DOTSEDRAFT_39628 [Dothistroma septosporum NZE10]|uniref:Uncharacterized protein n=1 Tax=Dothistroma septosporum (strain NZE10 / CBS 128990) TaxID=675120 RepID=M2WHL0_DOTSN|nr:hypothetical protein DOTSEDRAFT_39628 [Dothistroma septosporum NZE10]
MPVKKGEAHVRWDDYPEMRIALSVLHNELEMHVNDRIKVMNIAFAQELIACGYNNGFWKGDHIESQWREHLLTAMCQSRKASKAWKWQFDAEDRKSMVARLRNIAIPMALAKPVAGEVHLDNGDGAGEGTTSSGDDATNEKKLVESERDDGALENTDSDEDFVEGGRTRRRVKEISFKNRSAARPKKTTVREAQSSGNRDNVATNKRVPIATREATSRSYRVQPARKLKLRQSAMPKHQKFKVVGWDPNPVPGFEPLESTTLRFGRPPVDPHRIYRNQARTVGVQDDSDAQGDESSEDSTEGDGYGGQTAPPFVGGSDADGEGKIEEYLNRLPRMQRATGNDASDGLSSLHDSEEQPAPPQVEK